MTALAVVEGPHSLSVTERLALALAPISSDTAADRKQRSRERAKRGVMLVSVELTDDDRDNLVLMGALAESDLSDKPEVSEAVQSVLSGLLADGVEGKHRANVSGPESLLSVSCMYALKLPGDLAALGDSQAHDIETTQLLAHQRAVDLAIWVAFLAKVRAVVLPAGKRVREILSELELRRLLAEAKTQIRARCR